jgi:TorA-specific chaperone
MSTTLAREPASLDDGWYALIAEFLAGLFVAPPSADAMASYRDGLGAILFDALAHEPGCAPGAQRMRAFVAAEGSPTSVARKLALAFTHLFDGVDGPRTVSLYESTYVNESGRLFQASAGDMDRLLHRSNVSTADAFREPSDHLSIELALLARLMREDHTQQAQIALLDDHLLGWVPIFVARCCDADRTGFYAGAAWVLNGFLTNRRAALRRDGRDADPSPMPPHNPSSEMTPCRSA